VCAALVMIMVSAAAWAQAVDAHNDPAGKAGQGTGKLRLEPIRLMNPSRLDHRDLFDGCQFFRISRNNSDVCRDTRRKMGRPDEISCNSRLA
jgi:hypothetical protein